MTTQPDYTPQIVSAFLGGSVATILRELINWIRHPKLQIALDLSALKPFAQLDSQGTIIAWRQFVRLKIHNNGFRAAYRCEAKIEPLDEQGGSLFDPSILHWVRKSPEVYTRSEDQFAPITINRADHEFLDAIYIQRNSSPPYFVGVVTYSHRPYILNANTNYRLKVTVFSDNAEPKSVTIGFRWDGTWQGFNEQCVTIL